MVTNSMITMHKYPQALIKAIRKTENLTGVFHLTKGSSKYLYFISFEEDKEPIFNVVTYGDLSMKDYLLCLHFLPDSEKDYTIKNDKKKLILFLKEIFIGYEVRTILIDGEKLILDKTLYDAVRYKNLDDDVRIDI